MLNVKHKIRGVFKDSLFKVIIFYKKNKCLVFLKKNTTLLKFRNYKKFRLFIKIREKWRHFLFLKFPIS